MKQNPVFIVFLFIIISCSSGNEDATTKATYNYEKESEPLTYVDVLEASKGILVPVIKASGTVRGINETLVLSETQGSIKEVLFDIGDTLEQGAVLLKVDDTNASYNKDQAQLGLETAGLDLEVAQKYYKSGSISLVELKKTENLFYTRKVQYEQALKIWKDCTVKSPIPGVVAEKDASITKGAYITPGSPIARIVDTSYYTLTISVGERQIGFIKKDQNAIITIPAATTVPIEGKVIAVAGGTNRQTGSFSVILSWKNELGNKVKSGMSATGEINVIPEKENIIIPLFSMLKKDDGEYVFIAEDNKAVLKKVIPGNRFGERVEIEDGIKQGDLIIITRLSTLVPGLPVSIKNTGKSGEWQ
ncbi:MAG: efflux RND transporter periplasmic adaptor subunit [Spirochaetales bacterium]|nr:efflux RND transporter periplasmic adaptor subunit [Spirochaetales bacterium]